MGYADQPLARFRTARASTLVSPGGNGIDRDLERGRQAAAAARAAGASAIDVALAQIEATFDEGAAVRAFKNRCRRWIALGIDHPAVRARFGRRLDMLDGYSLDGMAYYVEHWYRTERQAFQIASALGRGSALSIEILKELRLILRWARARGLTEFNIKFHDEAKSTEAANAQT